jgi:hypothetical protein
MGDAGIGGAMSWPEIAAKLSREDIEHVNTMLRTEYARGVRDNGWPAFFKGMTRSATAWFGWFLLVAYPLIEPQLTPIMIEAFGDAWMRKAVPIIGIAVLVLRAKTTTSLEAKGKA